MHRLMGALIYLWDLNSTGVREGFYKGYAGG